MPRKIRQLKAELRAAGFHEIRRRGKGSHSYWEYDDYPGMIMTLSGHDGDDAKPYQEAAVAKVIRSATVRDSDEN